MKKLLEFIIFISYTILIFNLRKGLMIIFIANMIFMVVLKINLKKALYNILDFGFIILITTIINSLIINLSVGLIIGIRLIFVCNTTYIFSRNFTYMDLANVVEKIFVFMKLFNVEPKSIGLIVCIAVAFIPILNHELRGILDALKTKGYEIKITKLNVILQPFFTSILKKVDQIEEAMLAKGA